MHHYLYSSEMLGSKNCGSCWKKFRTWCSYSLALVIQLLYLWGSEKFPSIKAKIPPCPFERLEYEPFLLQTYVLNICSLTRGTVWEVVETLKGRVWLKELGQWDKLCLWGLYGISSPLPSVSYHELRHSSTTLLLWWGYMCGAKWPWIEALWSHELKYILFKIVHVRDFCHSDEKSHWSPPYPCQPYSPWCLRIRTKHVRTLGPLHCHWLSRHLAPWWTNIP